MKKLNAKKIELIAKYTIVTIILVVGILVFRESLLNPGLVFELK